MNDDDVSNAKAKIEQDQQARVAAVAEEIQLILKKHSCDVVAAPQISSDGRIVAGVQIVAR